jgi:hypothetical protein
MLIYKENYINIKFWLNFLKYNKILCTWGVIDELLFMFVCKYFSLGIAFGAAPKNLIV